MKGLLSFLAGIGAAAAIAQLARWRQVSVVEQVALDLNTADNEQLRSLTGDDLLVERIVENRPYRSKLDLLSRFVVPDQVYRQIKNRVCVDERAAHQPVEVA